MNLPLMSIGRSVAGHDAKERPKRVHSAGKLAKGVGTVVVGVLILDLVATLATLAFGWSVFKG